MVQTVIFTGLVHDRDYTVRGAVKHEPAALDRDINEFLADNPDIKLVDIKFSTVMDQDRDCIVGTALLIYEEPEASEDPAAE